MGRVSTGIMERLKDALAFALILTGLPIGRWVRQPNLFPFADSAWSPIVCRCVRFLGRLR